MCQCFLLQRSLPNGDKWQPVMTTLPPAPGAIIQLIRYRCGKNRCTTNRCNCRKAQLNCTDLCGCSDGADSCANQLEADADEDDDAEYETDDSER